MVNRGKGENGCNESCREDQRIVYPDNIYVDGEKIVSPIHSFCSLLWY